MFSVPPFCGVPPLEELDEPLPPELPHAAVISSTAHTPASVVRRPPQFLMADLLRRWSEHVGDDLGRRLRAERRPGHAEPQRVRRAYWRTVTRPQRRSRERDGEMTKCHVR